ncbi:MAG: SLC13 family permease [Caulobacterales bacterium]|nr:SLC13 family permease [Caulobacterales bacterium]
MDLIDLEHWRMWATFAGIVAVITLYCSERLPMEIISISAVTVVLIFFHLFPQPPDAARYGAAEILSGFASPALMTIMALLVIGQGMFHTGALEGPARRLASGWEHRPRLALAIVFATMFVVSAFINNTPVVVMFIPITAALAARFARSTSKVMMPLSFTCILAGMTTLIGSSTNLLVADILVQTTGEQLSFFAPTQFGLVLAGAGLVYLVVMGSRLLPEHPAGPAETERGGRQFIAQLDIGPNHPLVGKRPVAGMFPDLPNITVRLIQRGERAILPPFDDLELRNGDVIILAATRATLSELLATRADFLRGVLHAEDAAHLDNRESGAFRIVEAVVAPGARVINRTIEQAGFRHDSGAIVLGVQRRSRMIRARMSEIRLESGDVLLMFGTERALEMLSEQRDVLPLEWSRTDLPDIRRATVSRVIFAAVVAATATGVLPILHAALLGAIAMIGSGCMNLRQAARAFDMRIYLIIGAAFSLGGALQATGGAALLGAVVVGGFEPFGVTALLSAMFLLVAILTNILSNSATAILFAPVAVSAAERLGADPTMFVLTVLFAANCSFATPIAYQTNLLVMGPGRYQFRDFLRFGGPLVAVLWVVFTLAAPWAFGL